MLVLNFLKNDLFSIVAIHSHSRFEKSQDSLSGLFGSIKFGGSGAFVIPCLVGM
jgi:hypothetical protein